MKRIICLSAFLAACTLSALGAQQFNQFVAFGDSTLDTGYFFYHQDQTGGYQPFFQTAITNGWSVGGWDGNGVMNTTILAGKFGLNAVSAAGGGSNYAVGGATTMPNTTPVLPGDYDPSAVPPVDNTTITQIKNYLTAVNGAANPKALYLIKTGDNDATYVTNQIAIDPTWLTTHSTYLADGAAALATEVAALQAAGARTIVVRNSYDSALLSGTGGIISGTSLAQYQRTVILDTAEWADLHAAGVHFIPADNDSLFSFVAKNPTLFGFTPASVLASNAPAHGSSALIAPLTPAEQQGYLFVEGVHLTTAGQTIEADYTYSLLIAPNEISLLPENEVHLGLSRMATIQRQIELFDSQRGPDGINLWVNSGADSLQMKNATGFPDASGIPFGGTVGIDYLTPMGLIVGVAFTGGNTVQDFATGGNFNQVDEVTSLYAAYRKGPVWGNAVASYGLFQDTVTRPVALGIYTDRNHGNTTGQNLALALRAGGDFKSGRITTGPVTGVVMQQVSVKGFTESGGVSALSFDSQTRDSLVSQFGWRVSVDLNQWQPFAEATWNHEWSGQNRTITTALTTVQAPSYRMDTAPVATDWATASIGTSFKVNDQVSIHAVLTAECFNAQSVTYGGNMGVTISF